MPHIARNDLEPREREWGRANVTPRAPLWRGVAVLSRSLAAAVYHATRREFNGCFAGALLPSLALVGAMVGPSVLALQLLLVIIQFASVKPEPFFFSFFWYLHLIQWLFELK